jgi:hypothetical protein
MPNGISNNKIGAIEMMIKEASKFPEISRSGRTSAELQGIIDTLILSSESGKPYTIENVEAGKKYNSLQQRIRAQAKKLNLQVQIHFVASENTLYFRVPSDLNKGEFLGGVKTKNVKGIKTVVKA